MPFHIFLMQMLSLRLIHFQYKISILPSVKYDQCTFTGKYTIVCSTYYLLNNYEHLAVLNKDTNMSLYGRKVFVKLLHGSLQEYINPLIILSSFESSDVHKAMG